MIDKVETRTISTTDEFDPLNIGVKTNSISMNPDQDFSFMKTAADSLVIKVEDLPPDDVTGDFTHLYASVLARLLSLVIFLFPRCYDIFFL